MDANLGLLRRVAYTRHGQTVLSRENKWNCFPAGNDGGDRFQFDL
jgi:hypothetical protein